MSNEKIALYSGSFDPPTNGHFWIVQQLIKEYDKVYVAIGINPSKSSRFSISERLTLLKELFKDFSNVEVTIYSNMYQSDFANIIDAKYLIRGIRGTEDFQYETKLQNINEEINPKLNTVFLTAPYPISNISSSLVMGLLGSEAWEPEVEKMVPLNVFNKLREYQVCNDKEFIKSKWHNLIDAINMKYIQGYISIDPILQHYTEQHRYYHTLSHLKVCLNEFDLVKDKLYHPEAVEFALFFHDIRYNLQPIGCNNEKDSAIYSENILHASHGVEMFRKTVYDLIMSTKHIGVPNTSDEAYTRDIDLASFGRSERISKYYSELINKEYYFVPREEYRKARINILESFIDPKRGSIYYSDFFRNRYEIKAHKNIMSQLLELSTKSV